LIASSHAIAADTKTVLFWFVMVEEARRDSLEEFSNHQIEA
jgi:hypothetical protein